MSQQVVYINKERFYCDGGDELGHPRVYYTMVNGEAVCGYCNIKYIYEESDDWWDKVPHRVREDD